MSTFTFLHAADIHLDSPLRGLESYPDAPVEQIRGASRRALDNLVELAIEEQAAFVLLAGDVFDGGWRDFNTALFFAERMGRLQDAGIRVFQISGNHDAASTISKNLSPPDNVHVFRTREPESVSVTELGVVIHGQGYPRRDVSEDLAAGYPLAAPECFNIGLLHTALTGHSGHEPYAPTTRDILVGKGYDYWALGHVHQQEVAGREPWIVFSGTIQGRHIRETGPKGCMLVRVEEGQVRQVGLHELDVLRWDHLKLDLQDCDTQERLWSLIRTALQESQEQSEGRTLAVRLELCGRTPLHNWLHAKAPLVREECRTRAAGLGGIWLEKVRIRTEPEATSEFLLEDDAPLAGLVKTIQELSLESFSMDGSPELADLHSRLPPEIQAGENPLDLNDPEQLRQMQEDVQELLLGRLLRAGKES